MITKKFVKFWKKASNDRLLDDLETAGRQKYEGISVEDVVALRKIILARMSK